MNAQNLPKVGDRPFLMHREVIVINVYSLFSTLGIAYTSCSVLQLS